METTLRDAGPALDSASGVDGLTRLLDQIPDTQSTEEFCNAWLAVYGQLIPGTAEAVILLARGDRHELKSIASWPPSQTPARSTRALAAQAYSSNENLTRKASGKRKRQQKPAMAATIRIGGIVSGAVALSVDEQFDEEMATSLQRLENGVVWLEGFLARSCSVHAKNQATPKNESRAVNPQHKAEDRGVERRADNPHAFILDLAAVVLRDPKVPASSCAFVSELALRLNCDRVSLGLRRGNDVRVVAISHTLQFGHKTDLVRRIEEAMNEAFDQESVVTYPEGATDQEGLRATHKHAALVQAESYGASCSIPIVVDDAVEGVLTMERQQAERGFSTTEIKLCEATLEFVGPYLRLRDRDERWVKTRSVEALRTLRQRLCRPGHAAWKIGAVALVASVFFGVLATGTHRISARTLLEGSVQRAAVAPFEGFVAEASVRAGDVVKKGQTLCTLDVHDLELQQLKWQSEAEQLRKQYQQALAERSSSKASVLTAQLRQTQAQLKLIADRLERARIVAPFDGIVVSGDLSQSIGAPVTQGQVLFETAPLDSYRVVLEVDERDIEYVHLGQSGELVLAAFPSEALPFRIEKITPVSTAADGKNSFRVEGELESAPDTRMRPGLEGVGRIAVGERNLVWIWTHSAIDWLRLTLWKWTP